MDELITHTPLMSEEDRWILMYRDVHFSGNFELMLEYFQNGGIGCHPEIDEDDIMRLANFEGRQGCNLSDVCLSEIEQERVEEAQKEYQRLRDLFENPKKEELPARWLVRLIFAEEAHPLKEIAAVVHFYKELKPVLREILLSGKYEDTLSPGYGKAPLRVLRVLFHVKDVECIPLLFSLMQRNDFSFDSAVVRTLVSMGEPARAFLEKVMASKICTLDNENAAIALCSFPSAYSTERLAVETLDKIDWHHHFDFANYLINLCIETQDPSLRSRLQAWCRDVHKPQELRQEIAFWMDRCLSN